MRDEVESQDIVTPEEQTPSENTSSGLEGFSPRQALIETLTGGGYRKYVRFTMAALGAIPWVGSLLGAAASLSGERDQDEVNRLLALWVQEHEDKIIKLGLTLKEIFERFDNFGEEIQQRLNSEEYLALVRRTFTSWDEADTEEKRQMYKRLLISAGQHLSALMTW